ncbi:nucleotide-binding protein [Paenibacillus hexagrammi]|uniref:AAA family ATPase n=1 Tax=Paenibacillus hexagrammi TaxID=2908839 RepID=A0ABY3SSG3_9BACL|nr:AAA family ATPase [Paenibacillus sp. YPD9-1]UJF35956.1 AAA family ATPase [Paenibacillus sp. YPD9-1]
MISEAYYSLVKHVDDEWCWVVLSETISTTCEAGTAIPFLYRYQGLQQLLTRLLAFYGEKQRTHTSMRMNKRTEVYSVYSSVGGSGKTVTAIHLARQLAYRGHRVFYVSLESVSSASAMLQGAASKFSQLLYYAKSTPELLIPRIELLKSRDPRLGFDYLTPHDQIREMQEMKGEDVRILVEALLTSEQYDYLILDLESSLHPRIVKALELSDEVFWIVLDDLPHLFKTRAFQQQIGALRQVHFVLNKFTGKYMNDLASLEDEVAGKLPYIPDWKAVYESEQVWQSALFSEQVYEVFTSVRNQSFPSEEVEAS